MHYHNIKEMVSKQQKVYAGRLRTVIIHGGSLRECMHYMHLQLNLHILFSFFQFDI